MKKIIPLLAILTLTGCATVQNLPLDAKGAAALKGQAITHTTYNKPDFAAFTPGKAAGGLIGGLLMISAGNQIVAENDIQDPAPEIAAKLLKNMEQVHNMVPGKSPIQLSDNSIEKIAASSNGVPFILDVQTINWSFVYQPTDWTHYRVIYTAKARILDAKTKAVLAENICSNAKTPVPDPLPTHDELLANKAALIKEKLALASKECAEQFKSTLLSL